MTRRWIWLMMGSMLWLGGCAAVPVDHYRAEKPALDLARYFDGTVDAWGMFQDRSGKVVKRFHVVIQGTWKGNVGTLDEDFTYSDGTKSRRVWTLTRLDERRWRGTAADVVGEAAGEVSGNALHWRYVLELPVDGKTYHVDLDDWMYQMDDRVMINRTVMSKFGFRVGEITLTFLRRGP